MTEQEIIATINKVLAEEFELDLSAMTPMASFADDLGLDSLDAVDMVVVLEKSFGIKIRETEEIRKVRTLGDLHSFVINKKRALEEAACA